MLTREKVPGPLGVRTHVDKIPTKRVQLFEKFTCHYSIQNSLILGRF